MDEEYRPIPGFEGWYEISEKGVVRSCIRVMPTRLGRGRTFGGKVISSEDRAGRVALKKGGEVFRYPRGHLLAQAWPDAVLPPKTDSVIHWRDLREMQRRARTTCHDTP